MACEMRSRHGESQEKIVWNAPTLCLSHQRSVAVSLRATALGLAPLWTGWQSRRVLYWSRKCLIYTQERMISWLFAMSKN
jgi:hypothetical protein